MWEMQHKMCKCWRHTWKVFSTSPASCPRNDGAHTVSTCQTHMQPSYRSISVTSMVSNSLWWGNWWHDNNSKGSCQLKATRGSTNNGGSLNTYAQGAYRPRAATKITQADDIHRHHQNFFPLKWGPIWKKATWKIWLSFTTDYCPTSTPHRLMTLFKKYTYKNDTGWRQD